MSLTFIAKPLGALPAWGDEKCVQSACGIIEPKHREKWIVGLRLAKYGDLKWMHARTRIRVCARMKGRMCYMQVCSRGQRQSIKHKNDQRKGRKMSQPSGTGYGINPFGKACSLHTSTTNTRVSTEHECLGSLVQKNSLSDVVLAQIDCQFLNQQE